MIIPDSEKSESSVRSTAGRSPTSFGPVDDPPSPPPYSETVVSNDDLYHNGDHSPHSTGFNSATSARPSLPPRCNHLIDRKTFSSLSGTWHVDTALEIPDRLLPPITEFDGRWNLEVQQARKARAEAWRRHQASPSSRSDRLPPLMEKRPNLLLGATNGAISADVHVVSSDGLARQATVITEGCNGAISLRIHAPPDQLLRVFASSTNGSVNVKIPSSFEGALIMSTSWGSVNVSEAIKAKLTTFSSSSNKSRSFIGDWETQGFGGAANPNDDPPLPGPQDPFVGWNGPVVDISSTNGSINLSYIDEEDTLYGNQFTRAFQGFMDGWFGRGQNRGNNSPPIPTAPMFSPPHPPVFHPQHLHVFHPPHPPMFHPPHAPMFSPPQPGAWPFHPKSPARSAGVGGLDLD